VEPLAHPVTQRPFLYIAGSWQLPLIQIDKIAKLYQYICEAVSRYMILQRDSLFLFSVSLKLNLRQNMNACALVCARSRSLFLFSVSLKLNQRQNMNACALMCVCVCERERERERERLGKSGFKSTVSWTASKESSLSLVAKTALESPTFPITRSWPWKATFSHYSVVRSRFNLLYQKSHFGKSKQDTRQVMFLKLTI
jgi:hypothetical protein